MYRVFFVISICCIISLGYQSSGVSNVRKNRWKIPTTRSTSNKYFRNTTVKLKTILLWNSFFNMSHFNLGGRGRMPFQREGCSVNNCFVTDVLAGDLIRPVEEYNAILFHMYDIKWFPLPTHRKSHQRYVFLLMESPQSFIIETDYKDYFNWTMTYRRDSDIWWPYGSLTTRQSSIKEDPRSVNFHLLQPQLDTIESSIFDPSQKKYLVAWFVSNCTTVSRREIYVRELKKYIPIHIYGDCGNYNCSDSNRTACLELLERNYKFYLSFENSLCKDYVTEKLFDIIKYNVVPIVYGGANYSEMMPPMSYINVADFSTPQDLANYLLYLDKNPDKYVKYFWWKSYYRFQESKVMCQLCEMLHNSCLPHKVYPNIREWWEGDGTCKNTGNKLSGLLSSWIKAGNIIRHKNEMYLELSHFLFLYGKYNHVFVISCVFHIVFILLDRFFCLGLWIRKD